MSQISIAVILGTARPGRQSEKVANHVVETLKRRGVLTEFIDVAEYGIAGTGLASPGHDLTHYRDVIAGVDGIVIVAPEYNHGYPGELKLLLDSEHGAYVRKPVGFVSVSAGLMGGARVTEQLRLVAAAFRMVPVAPAVHVTQVGKAVGDGGEFVEDSLTEVLEAMLDELGWFAEVLSAARSKAL